MLIECPHCQCFVYIEIIACAIFRHGTFKHNNEPIPPHTSKELCDKLVAQDHIWGCGKPFKLVIQPDGTYVPEICDYI